MENLSNKRVAILATNGFEESELRDPKKALEEAGIQVDIISEQEGSIKSWANNNWSTPYAVDKTLDQVTQDHYDALMLPGGVLNPDTLRKNKKAIVFIRSFFNQGKPLAAICHGPSLLVDAGVLNGHKVTSYISIKKDLENAGAHWMDEEVVVDQGLITSRNPQDIPAFCAKLIEEIYENKYAVHMA
ncbi:type 1 glutamine amidotransferase domain-containing protein [Yeosuana marina]|uniref:type 1 glutamine amidotransferase domain-containing protein n=1 Tax=Yeosuana marina TaxID=1565536 RepID=UPI0030EF6C4C|tara:strand:- start:999 stop:1559 length:561 start_codon:yes stop_codon:yes gene_type:complete